jgi:hypothetical protein
MVTMLTADQLLRLAEAYGDAAGLTLTTVGRRACDNDKIFNRLAEGRGANILACERAYHWFDANWPLGEPWPAGIPRPHPRKSAA